MQLAEYFASSLLLETIKLSYKNKSTAHTIALLIQYQKAKIFLKFAKAKPKPSDVAENFFKRGTCKLSLVTL